MYKRQHIILTILLLIIFFMINKMVYAAQMSGKISYYANSYHGKRTANGEKYNKRKLTAAHKTLAFGTMVEIKNLKNKRKVIVRINDRFPFSNKRTFDLSRAAASRIGMIRAGVVPARGRIVGYKSKPSYRSYRGRKNRTNPSFCSHQSVTTQMSRSFKSRNKTLKRFGGCAITPSRTKKSRSINRKKLRKNTFSKWKKRKLLISAPTREVYPNSPITHQTPHTWY